MTNLNMILGIFGLGGAEFLIAILIIAVLAIPFLYLAALFNTIKLTNPNKRTISPWSIWLALIPIVGIFCHYYHIIRINETLESEFKDRGIKQHNSQFGFTAGKTFSSINILLFFVNIFYSIYYWVSIDNINKRAYNEYSNRNEEYSKFLNSTESMFIGLLFILASIITLICWIIYWSRISNCKKIILNHNTQMGQNKNSFSQNTSNVLNSINRSNSLKQNVTNVLTTSSQLLNNTSNNYQNIENNNQTKKCPDCSTDIAIGDNFCIKCGFNFNKYEQEKKDRLKENEKECPECKLVLNKDVNVCSNCGFPFQLNKVASPIIQNTPPQPKIALKEEQVKLVTKEPQQIIEEKKVVQQKAEPREQQSKPVAKAQKQIIEEESNSNKTLYIVIGVILLLVIGGIIWFYGTNQGPSKQELFAREKHKQDSIASFENNKAVQESQKAQAIADSTASYTASQKSLSETGNKDEVAAKIYKYYEDLQLDKLDANEYFASNVSQFYTKKNVTPSDINNINASGKSEFSNPEVTLDVNNIVLNRTENDINYYTFGMHFKCYRTSKQKTEECDETIEIGVNKSDEFVSLKELKIENLKFYSEGDNRSSDLQPIPKTEILSIVEQMPSFPGGETEMMKFVQQNITYPQLEKEAGISGTVYVTFVVDTYGNLSNIEVLRGVSGGKGCNNEAIRVVKLMPKWIAGRQNGKAVNVQFNLPIKFTLR